MRLSIAAGVATFAAAVLLYPLFEGGGWFWASLGAVLAVAAASLLCGRLTLPAWAAALVSVAALWIYLTASFASEEAWALFVPTKGSVAELIDLLGVGWKDIQRFAAPVPANEAVTFLTAGGVGLIALTVDLLAARIRRAALAGLPLLALAVVPVSILSEPIDWPAFILAALGFTSLLIADGRERVGHWGRAVLVRRTRTASARAEGSRDNADTSRLRLSGKRIGFAAIALAVLLPALLPSMEPVSLFTFGVGGTGSGKGNSISIPNPIANLKGQLDLPERREVLTYTSSDDKPRYLRIYALDTFDGQQFGMSEPKGAPENKTENGPLPPATGLTSIPVKDVTTNVRISEEIERLSFLPLPYPPKQIQVDGDWRADVSTLMVFSTREEAAGLEYDVVTGEPQATPELLESLPQARNSIDPRFLRLPPNLPLEIRLLAERVTRGATSNYEAAVKLQEFFTKTGGFQYSLETQGHSTSALQDFLIQSRVGYCEQFAASMAVLARIVGIPSRVAIGYTGGMKLTDRWTVGTNDSHSWPELYFEGVGWLPFEPTPAGTLGQGSARVPAYTLPRPRTTGDTSVPTPGATSSAEEPLGPNNRPNLRQLDREAQNGGAALPIEEPTPIMAQVGIGAGVLLLILLIPAAVRLVTRSRRVRVLGWKVAEPEDELTARVIAGRHPSVAAAWAELDDVLHDYGMTRQSSETPRALARRLTQQYEFDADAAAAITAIASAVERVLFARDPGVIGPMKKDLRTVRKALAATVSRGRRMRAVLLPPSTLRRMRNLGERLLDGFDLLENIRLRRTAGQRGS
ncbi:DUF4129 domain-containing protein [Nonomuraea sp. NN258]|uniref:transglutaminaseTgpA domain-containing protein n=1 Tax=Nonomuraea antri TaxID=2730852 RepID=UPI00156A52E7|nr:transglutaminaseTgpA domain-containing protein [Nonomuraea antri]NRQ34203.1 DUF4129 domain-containing protein [Nonomuraea antri]